MIDYKAYKKFLKNKLNKDMYFSEVTFDMCSKPITILVGPNGSGKSRSLFCISQYLKSQNIKFDSYQGRKHGSISYYVNPYNHNGMTYREGIIAAFRSEGEQRTQLFNLWLSNALNDKSEVILIDEFDSGLSIDRIWSYIGGLHKYTESHKNIKFIITANQFETIQALSGPLTDIIFVPTLQKWEPKTYQEFKKPYIWFISEIEKRFQKPSR